MIKRFPFPKRYWIYLILVLIFSILLIGNIFRTDSWTGDKPFSEFVLRDWQLLFLFLIEEIIIASVMFLFGYLACRISKKRNAEITVQWEMDKYLGIKPGDYDYVWFDFSNTERALILKQDDKYKLYVQEYDEHTGNWESLSGVSVYESLEAVKKALFYECDFYCEENTELDKYGYEIYLEEIQISITSIQSITNEGITFFDEQGDLSKIRFLDAHKKWCIKYRINKPTSKYVCDRTNSDSERKMIFYTNPQLIVLANKNQENMWIEMLDNMKSFGYFSFDRD